MEFENIHIVASLGFLLAMVFGAVANRTGFCTMGAVSDLVNMGLTGRLGSWVLAMGIAIIGTQILELTGIADIGSSIYRVPALALGGYLIGGLMFGIGMTLGGGCGQRTLVRVGGGNLKSLVVFLVLGISAYMTLRGLFGVARLGLIEPLTLDLGGRGLEEQGLAAVVASLLGVEASALFRMFVALIVAALLIFWALRQRALRENFDNLLAGVVVGLLIVASWFVTGSIGADDFDPVPTESLTFIAPAGNSISYLMTYTGATINFGIAVVFGMILGSFLYAVASRTFSIETFTDRQDMINHLWGGLLMGVGGVLSLGCTIGQGVSGISTLAVGSFIAVFAIVVGSALTMRTQYHRMDDLGFGRSLFTAIADIALPWRMKD